jgi:hypothetical protein
VWPGGLPAVMHLVLMLTPSANPRRFLPPVTLAELLRPQRMSDIVLVVLGGEWVVNSVTPATLSGTDAVRPQISGEFAQLMPEQGREHHTRQHTGVRRETFASVLPST